MFGALRRVPLGLQVGAVATLFIAASVSLWFTGSAVVERERRRASAEPRLREVGEMLEARGKGPLSSLQRGNPFVYLEAAQLDDLERQLTDEARLVQSRFPEVEAGYLVLDSDVSLFIPRAADPGSGTARTTRPPGSTPYGYIETQADAAIRKNQRLLVVEVLPNVAIAIQTAPIHLGGRLKVATWAMIRLEDPLFVDRSVRGYRLSAGLALCGIALAMALTVGLARTVRRQVEERERLQVELRRSERLAALGKLLAGVAHEVRNPLAGIRSTVQLWQRGIGPDEESFDGMLAEVDRLEGIVSRLLGFSKADAQDLAPGDLNDVVTEAARLARGPAEEQGIDVQLDLEPGLPPVEMAAPALVQVIRNLTTNAIQAMPDGGAIRLTTRAQPDRQLVTLQVADTGPGLPEEVAGHLFEPFFTTKAGGTGLGLAIAREIALAHRGDLRAEDRDGRPGAAFLLTLPAAELVAEESRR